MEETIMRKWHITLLTLLLAFTACRQEPVIPDNGNFVDPSKLHFNLTIQHPDGGTKGVKTDWEDGDKVFIFISGIGTGYITASVNGTVWTTTYVGSFSLGTSGNLHAVYLPYGNNATPAYSENGNKWTFSEGTDTYYFYASNVPYTVETIGAEQVLSATVQMVKPGTYVQFYIPYASATGTIRLACNALCPAGFASIDATNGSVTENSGTAGTPISGYADTLAGEEGYYVSGIPVTTQEETADYYFALEKGSDYSHYYKNREAIDLNKAYQLPAYSNWPRVGGSGHVLVANGSWKTVNEGAEHPWHLGEPQDNSYVLSSGEGLPTATDWNNLLNNATWITMDIWDSHGSLVVSSSVPHKYLFIPWSGSVTNYWMKETANFDNAFQIAQNGDLTIPDPASVPGEAYVRTLEKVSCFRIRAKEEGTTTLTFKYTYANGGIEYLSPDLGVTEWTHYDGSQLSLSQNNVVYFRGTRTDCNCSGNTQLFTADKVCYIAGEIASLLGYPQSLPDNAFRSAFSTYGTNNPNSPSAATLGKDFTEVTWVDIDPLDPLILPASTAANCYLEMFMGCTSLTSAPDLPATALADKCYFRMFHSCSGLESIPSFPSTAVTWTGNRFCYQMFQSSGITALTEPLFGGTSELGTGCFEDMFAHCTSLTSVISGLLPATSLAADCYRGMFQDTRFQRAPDLLVTDISYSNCYRFMFDSCSKLNYIKCLATNPSSATSNNPYTQNWVQKVPTGSGKGTFVTNNTSNMTGTWATTGNNGIPSGWTVIQVSEENPS